MRWTCKDPRGVDLVRDLVRDADGFVDVYRPGVAERLGLGPDDLIAINPRLVYARMTGYGQDGPYVQDGRPRHQLHRAQRCAPRVSGTPDTPVPPLNILGDFGGGGMLLAGRLAERDPREPPLGDGTGDRRLDARRRGHAHGGVLRDARPGHLAGSPPGQHRRRRRPLLPHLRDRGREALRRGRVLEPQFYAELCARLGVAVPHDDDDPETWAADGEVIVARFREKTRGEWEAELVTPQSCAAPVLSLTEAPLHPQNRARAHVRGGRRRGAARARAALSRTVVPVPGGPALPGAQTVSVLVDLGLDDDTVRDLRAAGVVRQRG